MKEQDTITKIKATCKSIEYFDRLAKDIRDEASIATSGMYQRDLLHMREIVVVALGNLEMRLAEFTQPKED